MKHIKDFETIVWDWNGTLLNDLEVVMKAEAEHFIQLGIKVPTREERDKLFCFPIQKYYERLGFDFSKMPFSEVQNQFMHIYEEHMKRAELFAGTREMLAEIADSHRRQFVLSAAPQLHLEQILSKHSVDMHFDGVYGLPHHNADTKIHRGRELIEEQKIDPSKTLMIGDTDHDFEVAQALGFEALLVADGHKSYDELSRLHHRVLRSRFE